MRPFLPLALALLLLPVVFAWEPLNYTIPEKPVYENPYTRPGNFTIKIPLPGILRGITPRLQLPVQLRYDQHVLPTKMPPRLDPATCPLGIARCYQIRRNNDTRPFTYGKNYSAASTYRLPSERVKEYLCNANDTGCVAQATSCACEESPFTPPPKPEYLRQPARACAEGAHLCRSGKLGFTICKGDFATCTAIHDECSCGRLNVCYVSTQNACLNERGEMLLCRSPLRDCVEKYPTCFCGGDLLRLQAPCATTRHACVTGGVNITCVGKFVDCALKHDTCAC